MDNKDLKIIADAMLEKKGQNVVSLDLRVIGTAISDLQRGFNYKCDGDCRQHRGQDA